MYQHVETACDSDFFVQVDIDLASEGDARKVSRHQAHLTLQQDGVFRLKNVGRRTVLVNNRQVRASGMPGC